MDIFNTSTTTTITSPTFRSDDSTTSINEGALQLSVTIILAIFIVFSVLGNSLVCYVFYRQPQLRRVVYYPVISLAVADLLCGTLAMPAYIARKHVRGGWWEGFTCDLFRFTYFFTAYASILSLTIISVERFISVTKPVMHRTWLTRRKITAFLLVSWFDAAAVSVLPFFWRKGTDNEPCISDPTREWSLVVIVANVFIPFLIMLFCHAYTVSFALRYLRKRKTSGPQNEWQPTTERKDKNTLKRERNITRTLRLIVGAFVVCWGPSTFYNFIQMVCLQCLTPTFISVKPIFNAVVKLLTFANSCVNPLIYYWLNPTLRNAVFESLLGRSKSRKRAKSKCNHAKK